MNPDVQAERGVESPVPRHALPAFWSNEKSWPNLLIWTTALGLGVGLASAAFVVLELNISPELLESMEASRFPILMLVPLVPFIVIGRFVAIRVSALIYRIAASPQDDRHAYWMLLRFWYLTFVAIFLLCAWHAEMDSATRSKGEFMASITVFLGFGILTLLSLGVFRGAIISLFAWVKSKVVLKQSGLHDLKQFLWFGLTIAIACFLGFTALSNDADVPENKSYEIVIADTLFRASLGLGLAFLGQFEIGRFVYNYFRKSPPH